MGHNKTLTTETHLKSLYYQNTFSVVKGKIQTSIEYSVLPLSCIVIMQVFINQTPNLFALSVQKQYHTTGVHSLSLTFAMQGEKKSLFACFHQYGKVEIQIQSRQFI